MNIWQFNNAKVIGLYIFNLPIEEILFFFIIPYCCVFVYECICCYFPKLVSSKLTDNIIYAIGILALLIGVLNLHKWYTTTTGVFLAVFIGLFYFFRKELSSFNSKAFLIAYAIIQIPFMVVNGLLTAIPVITYNDTENLGSRIYTIPAEDTFYGMLLIMFVIIIYEKLRERNIEKLIA
jgi:lycopene cyclase domain-containing protein